MKLNHRKFRALAVTVFFMLPLYAATADKVIIFPYKGSVHNAAVQYKIGDRGPAGGFVFYVSNDGQHGLEAAPVDQSTGIRWYNGINTNTEARGNGVGAGEMNTVLIIANQGSDSNSYAAGLCANLVLTNAGVTYYGDWYLPSIEELNLIYSNLYLNNVGGFFPFFPYWTSSEEQTDAVWGQSFWDGYQSVYYKYSKLSVRAVRAF
jgi:hypothetical protein